MWNGRVVQYKEWQKNVLTCGIQHWFSWQNSLKVSQTLKHSSVHDALSTKFDASNIWKFCAPGTNVYCADFQFLCHCHPSVFGVLTSGTGITGFFTSSGLTSFSKNCLQASLSLPMPPDVIWAEPPNAVLLSVCWWWYGTLLDCLLSTCDGMAHCWGRPVCCPAKVVPSLMLFCEKKSIFIWLCSRLLGGQPTAYCQCWVSATCHRPHIGCQFLVVMGFKLSPLEG